MFFYGPLLPSSELLLASGGSGAISGTATIAFSQSGALTGDGALAASVALAFGQSGALAGAGALAGTSALTFSQSGDLSALGSGAISGTVALTFGQSGAVAGAGALAGTAAVTFSQTAALAGSGAISGTVPLTFGQSGNLSGSAAGAISGTTALAFGSSATLAGLVALSGSATLLFGASGTFLVERYESQGQAARSKRPKATPPKRETTAQVQARLRRLADNGRPAQKRPTLVKAGTQQIVVDGSTVLSVDGDLPLTDDDMEVIGMLLEEQRMLEEQALEIVMRLVA